MIMRFSMCRASSRDLVRATCFFVALLTVGGIRPAAGQEEPGEKEEGTAVTIEREGRSNPFRPPPLRGPQPGEAERPKREVTIPKIEVAPGEDEWRRRLDELENLLREAEEIMRTGDEIAAKPYLEQARRMGRGFRPEIPQEKRDRLERLLEKAEEWINRVEAIEEFRNTGLTISFIVYRPDEPERSVAAVSGRIVSGGGTFPSVAGRPIEVVSIDRDRVEFEYRGIRFRRSMAREAHQFQ